MAYGGTKFSYGIADISSVTLGGNGYSGRYHINKYAIDLTGVDYIRVKQYYTGNLALVITNALPAAGTNVSILWQSAYKSVTANTVVTFQGSEIPSQYKNTGYYLGLAYDTDRAMNNYQGTGTYAGMKLYSSTGALVYDYTGYTEAIEINYLQYYRKFLFQDGTDIVKFVSGVRTVVGTAPVTEAMFTANGMIDLVGITSTQLNLLTNSKKLLSYNSSASATSNALNVKFVPYDKLIIGKNDISLLSTNNIDSFTLTANQTGNGVLRVIASNDGGITWYTYNGSAWNTINPVATDVKTNGMNIATFNAANWNSLLNSNRILRFAYLLSLTASTDVAEVDKLANQVDMTGYYFVDKDANHDVCRISDNVLEVSIYSSGDYKISYIA